MMDEAHQLGIESEVKNDILTALHNTELIQEYQSILKSQSETHDTSFKDDQISMKLKKFLQKCTKDLNETKDMNLPLTPILAVANNKIRSVSTIL